MNDVVLRGVGIAYESDVVVSGLDLDIGSGEWLALIGPNGAGKTTILRAIARLVTYQGEIRIGGQAVAEMGGPELARRVALVMQQPHMPEGMSVSQYVLLGRSPHLTYFGREGRRDHQVVAGRVGGAPARPPERRRAPACGDRASAGAAGARSFGR